MADEELLDLANGLREKGSDNLDGFSMADGGSENDDWTIAEGLGTAAEMTLQDARRVLRGATAGLSEMGLEAAGVDPLPKTTGLLEVGQDVMGATAGFMAGGAALRGVPIVQRLMSQAPRLYSAAEAGGLSGLEGASREWTGGGDWGDVAAAGVEGGAMGLLGEGIIRGAGGAKDALREGFASPTPRTVGGRLVKGGLDKARLSKQQINQNLKKLYEKHGIPLSPTALRPRDWFTDIVTRRASRSSTSRPYLQETADKIDKALGRMQEKVVREVGVGGPLLVSSNDMGRTIKQNFARRMTETHDAASQVYDDVMNSGLGDYTFDPKRLRSRLVNLLDDADVDPAGTGADAPGVNTIRAIIKGIDKNKATSSVDDVRAAWGSAPEAIAYRPMTYNHFWTRSKRLFKRTATPWTEDDFIKAEARDIIRDELQRTASRFSTKAAGALAEADGLWRQYRVWQKDPFVKRLLKSDAAKVVDDMLTTTDTIDQAREIMGPKVFDMARQRWMANLLYKGQPPHLGNKVLKAVRGAETEPVTMDINALLSAVKSKGGVDSEHIAHLFADAPDKLKTFTDLVESLESLKETRRIYSGETEIPGAGESQDIASMLQHLFSFGQHLLFSGAAGRAITRDAAENVFLGAAIPKSAPSNLLREAATNRVIDTVIDPETR